VTATRADATPRGRDHQDTQGFIILRFDHPLTQPRPAIAVSVLCHPIPAARPAIGSKVTKTAIAGRGCVRGWSKRSMMKPWVSWWSLPRGVAPGSHLPQTAHL